MGKNPSEDQPSAVVKVRCAAQNTLPREIRRAAHLEESDFLEAEVTDSGILLRPVSLGSRDPTAQQEAEILAVVNKECRSSAAQRRRFRERCTWKLNSRVVSRDALNTICILQSEKG